MFKINAVVKHPKFGDAKVKETNDKETVLDFGKFEITFDNSELEGLETE